MGQVQAKDRAAPGLGAYSPPPYRRKPRLVSWLFPFFGIHTDSTLSLADGYCRCAILIALCRVSRGCRVCFILALLPLLRYSVLLVRFVTDTRSSTALLILLIQKSRPFSEGKIRVTPGYRVCAAVFAAAEDAYAASAATAGVRLVHSQHTLSFTASAAAAYVGMHVGWVCKWETYEVQQLQLSVYQKIRLG